MGHTTVSKAGRTPAMIRATCINPGESVENTASMTSAFSAKPFPLDIDILTTLSGARFDAGM